MPIDLRLTILQVVTQTHKALILLITAALAYALFAVPYRAIEEGFAFFFGNFLTRAVLFILFLVLMLRGGGWHPLSRKDAYFLVGRGLIGVIAFISDFFGVLHVPLVLHYCVVFSTLLLTTAFMGSVLYKERLNPSVLVGLAFTLCGLSLLFLLGGSAIVFTPWLFVSMLGGVSGSLWQSLEKLVNREVPHTQITMFDFGVVASAYVLISIITREAWTVPGVSTSWLAIYAIGALIGWIGYATVSGFRKLESEKASLILLLQLPFSALVGLLVFSETVSLGTIASGMCIVLGAVIAQTKLLTYHKKSSKLAMQ